jgi:hypothetical protein
MDVVIEAAEAAVKAPNLWGALGCALTYAAALFATVDAFADLLLTPGDTPDGRLSPALRLKAGSKLSAAGIAVVSAAIVLALDANWFAFTTLGVAFLLLTGLGAFVLVRQRALVSRLASERPGWPDGGASEPRPLT